MKYQLKINKLNDQLNFIHLEIDDAIEICEKAIKIILTSVEELKKDISKRKFKSQRRRNSFFSRDKTSIYFKANLLQQNL